VLPPGVLTLSVEAATTFGWDRYADDSIGVDRFGASAPGDVVMRELGFTVENVVGRAEALLALEKD
jgi:transketolase